MGNLHGTRAINETFARSRAMIIPCKGYFRCNIFAIGSSLRSNYIYMRTDRSYRTSLNRCSPLLLPIANGTRVSRLITRDHWARNRL